ncbi:hypothetical protein PanWU01x14_344290, partial [Parasponia andersonii]
PKDGKAARGREQGATKPQNPQPEPGPNPGAAPPKTKTPPSKANKARGGTKPSQKNPTAPNPTNRPAYGVASIAPAGGQRGALAAMHAAHSHGLLRQCTTRAAPRHVAITSSTRPARLARTTLSCAIARRPCPVIILYSAFRCLFGR